MLWDNNMEYPPMDVTVERHLWLGGSDMKAVFGTTLARNKLALEKINPSGFGFSNKYTEYGHLMEPYIREWSEEVWNMQFEETSTVCEELAVRGNDDGYCKARHTLLECKTSTMSKTFEDCIEAYKYQMLTYAWLKKGASVILTVLFHDNTFEPFIDEHSHIDTDAFTYRELLQLCNLTEQEFEDGILDFWDLVDSMESGDRVLEVPGIDNLLVEYAELSKEREEIDARMSEVKKELTQNLNTYGFTSYKNSYGSISSVAPSSKISLDKDAVQAAFPDWKSRFGKTTESEGYIRVSIKGGE